MAATVPESIILSDENQPRGKLAKDLMDHESRKTFQSLQLSAKGEKLVGKGREQTGIGKKIKPSTKPVTVFSDCEAKSLKKNASKTKRSKSVDVSAVEERSTQTDVLVEDVFAEDELTEADREALDLMSGEEAPESYWQILADERRKALNDTLEENEELHKEIGSLREENELLIELANKASYLSNILQDVISDDDENSDDGADVEKDCSEDDDQTETATIKFNDNISNSSLNTGELPSKILKSDHIFTSSPIHAASHAVSKTEHIGSILSPLFQDICTSELNSVASDDSSVVETGNDNAVILREKPRTSRLKTNRDSDEWVNVELDNDMVASSELITSDKLVANKD